MNKDFTFSDTFDNFSFSESGRFFTRDNSKLNANSKYVSKFNQIEEEKVAAITSFGSITIDDSAFLNEFVSPCDVNIDCDNFNSSLKDSEDLFGETPEKLNKTKDCSGNDTKLQNNANNSQPTTYQYSLNVSLDESVFHEFESSTITTNTDTKNASETQKDEQSQKADVDKRLKEDSCNVRTNSESINYANKPPLKVEDINKTSLKTDDLKKLLSIETTNHVQPCLNTSNCETNHKNPTEDTNKDATDKKINATNATLKIHNDDLNIPNYCNLSSWGLPEQVLQKYASRGITSMFEWQAKCLGNPNILQRNSNLVYSAPTSAGKTLVAEILAIKTVLERHKKVLFILPFVSVVREKMFYFQDILGSTGVRVEGFMGSHNPPGGFQTVQVAICTIEKANGIINRLLEEGTLSDIGTVIVDEMHLLGDYSRGYLLELMLTKLQYMSKQYENVQIQIIGMSATLPNLDLLGTWLKAELFVTDFRPIPLYEQCLVGGEIFNKNLQLEHRLSPLPELEADSDNILQLCLETIQNSCSVLIFCPTKNWCENLSQQIATAFWKIGCSKSPFGLILREQLKSDLIRELLEQLKRCPVGLDKILGKTAAFGVAFHHAGLTMDERDIVESAFRTGALRVLVATSTLSSGVNLPARRVLIRTPMFHGKPLNNLVYRQMIGRAGRMGKDTCGESILICQKTDCKVAKELLSAELPPIESCLEGSGRLKRAILEVVASGVAATPDDVDLFTNCTLLAASGEGNIEELASPIEEAVEFLCRNEFIRLQKLDDGTSKYTPTPLGKACLSSSMPPEEGLALFAELEKARQCFVLETELHIIYTVTPYSVCNQWINLDWLLFLDMWEKLPASMKRVGELVGIREAYIINASRNKIQTNTSKLYQKLQIHRRFFTALALQDLVNEVPLNEVAEKFGCSRGMLQSLQQSASTFAGMLTIFSKQLGWSSVEILISQFQDRLQFGINRDLLDLMRLPVLNGPRARALYSAGIETLAHLAAANVCSIENILHKVVPFESEKEREGESEFAAQQRNKIRGIFITGKESLTEREAAVMLVQDARRYLQLEFGLTAAKWETDKSDDSLEVTSENTEDSEKPTENSAPQETNHKLVTTELQISAACSNKNQSEEQATSDQYEVMDLSASFELKLSPESSTSISITDSHLNKSGNKTESSGIFANVASDLQCKVLNISDQSLFEDSFKLNQQLAHCATFAENDSKTNTQEAESESTSFNNANNGDSGLDFGNESFLENAFASSFNLESEESHGKISDVVANSPDSNVSKNYSGMSLKKKLAVDESNSVIAFKNLTISDSPKSVQLARMSRKRERKDKENFYGSSVVDEEESLYGEHTPTKKRKVQTSTKLRDNTNSQTSYHKSENHLPLDLTKFHVISVCDNKKLYETFCAELLEQSVISLSFACSKVCESKPRIGANVIPKDVQRETVSLQFTWKDRQVVGFVVAWGGNAAYFVSFNNVAIIQNSTKIETLKGFLSNKSVKIRAFDCKEQVKAAKLCCDMKIYCSVEDPKVADWLMNPEGKEKNLQAMALKYAPEAVSLSQLAGNCKGVGSIGLDLYSSIEPRIRAAIEAVVTWHLCEAVCEVLAEQNSTLLGTYQIEMSSILCLARMELNGLGVNRTELQALADNLKTHTVNLEKQAYALAGRRFSLTSYTDVAKVLGLYRGRKVSVNKQVLQQQEHPIAKLILLWRKLNSALTKMVYPLIRLVQNDRIHGCCVTHSSTGRISMHEPNLQNIPKDFEVEYGTTNSKSVVSCRTAFAPSSGHVFLSADYCQLEFRLLTHFSQDPVLSTIMMSGQDVFKSVAAKWKNIRETEVDDVHRQWAKQLCYGIIYGMGVKALAEQLSVQDEEASKFMESFQDCYPLLKKYLEETVKKCRELGYVETLAGRRRDLSHINDQNRCIKSQAERQAVNTTIQGSAADVAKKAMVLIENRFQNKFRHPKNLPKLVLHLHDELLYEVPEKYLLKTAKILKESMEEAVKLSIPFPVKLKSGTSWGTMKELIL